MEHPEDEAEICGHRRLAGEQPLDPFLDPDVAPVDRVVEADDLLGELSVLRLEGAHRAAQGADDQLALVGEALLELLELLVEGGSHPNRPVT